MSNNNNLFDNNSWLAELFDQKFWQLEASKFLSLEFGLDENKLLQSRFDFLGSRFQLDSENDRNSDLLENLASDKAQKNGNNSSNLPPIYIEDIGQLFPEEEHSESAHLDVLPIVSNYQVDFSTTSSENVEVATASFDLAQTFFLHSNPGAKHVIYLDFDGHITTNTSWNSYTNLNQIVTPAYDFDGNTSFFSDTELTQIQSIWQRVAEDFIPFDVNVTTEEVDLEALRRTNNSDTEWGVRIVIGGDNSWLGGGGGVAYLDSFNWSSDTPAFVFEDNLANGNEKYTAEAISHEAGHSLGLEHDGNSSTAYYTGHGSGSTGWAPIMGVGYYQELSQWSQGEYNDANNTEDDLTIITTKNGFGYRTDDHGDTNGNATPMMFSGSSVSGNGIISQNNDYDVFSFFTGTGEVNLNILSAERGANLDILGQLYDSSGMLVAASNPTESLDANFSLNLVAGQYYLHVTGTGKDGAYSDYGSLGQYSIAGSVVVTANDFLSLEATDAIKNEGDAESTQFTFTVTRSGDISQETEVAWTVTGSGANPVDSNDFVGSLLPNGLIQFASNETSKEIVLNISGDTLLENDENFLLSLNNPAANTVISIPSAEGTILNDDEDNYVQPSLSINDVTVTEGTGSALFTVTRSGDVSETVTVEYSTSDGRGKNGAKAGSDYTMNQGLLNFAPGETTLSIAVTLINDTSSEPNESFFVNLSNVSSNATLSDFQGIATIGDDDLDGGKGGGKGGGGPKKKASIVSYENITEVNQIDTLTGSPTVDRFVLGDENQSYYINAGNDDYALIENFQLDEDFIQFYGTAENYVLGASPFNSQDTGIFLQTSTQDELIAIVRESAIAMCKQVKYSYKSPS
ncbi:MAG: Calx-beta domain-containing protein [Xenococcaceae cyanobacterium MO_188.B32]|nr:Calx-beta domain-containing protein [Xenococcaceae cyanobacterium MO_188.B32]